MSRAVLYVVATPIGNLNEMTPRAIEVLQNVAFIASEDTRNTRKLCQHFNISTPLVSCHEHNESVEVKKIIEALEDGRDVALVSDAGFPAISDPGQLVVAKVIDAGYKVEVISGPCALINALVGSGLPTTHFYFHGFLSHKVSEKRKELDELKEKNETLIFYESPHRINDTLDLMIKAFGPRKACIARELTKKFEEYIRGTLESIRDEVIKRGELKGEMVIVIEGSPKVERPTLTNFEIVDEVNKFINEGLTTKDAIKKVADLHKISKNTVYQLFHQ